MADTPLTAAATKIGTTPDRIQSALHRTLDALPQQHYYVFRITSEQRTATPPRKEPRMIPAFPSPDDALAFAQRNGYGSRAQLRSINAAELILRMLLDESIGTVLFLRGADEQPETGFGSALKVRRDALIAELRSLPTQSVPNEPPVLTAERYDSFQWGIDFVDRAEFRVALAEQLEHIVATYQPPEGSVDRGPRSIFATTVIEQWLREHGFPHAYQRRWIDVAGDPRWNGAEELVEIDGGTQHTLLIQIAIHTDEHGRQYIKWVNVTT